MAIRIKHIDPTLNEFSTDDVIINVQSGSLFFKSNTKLFKLQGDDQSTTDITDSLKITGLISSIGPKYVVELDGNDGSGPRINMGNINELNSDKFMTIGAFASINQIDTKTRDFHLYGTNTTTGFYFDESAGNFGIGTTSPKGVVEFRNTETDSGAVTSKQASNVYLIASNQGNLDEERYYELATINDNNGHLSIKGILAGHTHDQGNAEIDIKISQRESGLTSYPLVTGTINGQIGTAADIISTDDSGNSKHKIYLKTAKYSLINLDLKTTEGVTLTYDRNTFITAANFTETIRFGFNAHDDTAGYVPYYFYSLRQYSPNGGNLTPNYYTPSVTNFNGSDNKAIGWYTIATAESGRAQGRFHILDTHSGQHQAFVFYATHMYGVDASNAINIVSYANYGGNDDPIGAIRIKDLSTYDGAVLQIYIAEATSALNVSLLDDFGANGWRLKNFIPEATDPGGVSRASNSTSGATSAYASFTEAAKIEIADVKNGGTGTTSHFYVGKDLDIAGTVSKGAGSFKIDHPDPTKTNTHHLYHNFVESPTEGDNIYRWTITTTNKTHTIILPDYYKFLNKNDMVWVSAVNHFGRAYGTINNEQTKLTITSDIDGKYNVLLIGTRKDQFIKDNYQGVEVLK